MALRDIQIYLCGQQVHRWVHHLCHQHHCYISTVITLNDIHTSRPSHQQLPQRNPKSQLSGVPCHICHQWLYLHQGDTIHVYPWSRASQWCSPAASQQHTELVEARQYFLELRKEEKKPSSLPLSPSALLVKSPLMMQRGSLEDLWSTSGAMMRPLWVPLQSPWGSRASEVSKQLASWADYSLLRPYLAC